MENLHIITVATESKFYFPYLIESCKRNGKELKVLGMGKKWEGYNMRYNLMIDYLNTLQKYDIVCIIDGYDVLCTRDLNELIPKFKEIQNRTKCKIIVGDDSFGYFFLFSPLFFGKCKNESINAGTYIGYVKDILEIIQNIYELNPKNDSDDQLLMTNYCQQNPTVFYIDKDSELFLKLGYGLQELDQYVEIKNNVLTYNNIQPFFIHAAGNGYLDNIIKKLGYEYKDNIKEQIAISSYDKIMYHLTNFMKMYILYFIIFLILLVIIYYRSIILYYLSKTVKRKYPYKIE